MKNLSTAIAVGLLLVLTGCGESVPHTRAVYLLLDTSGTYTKEIKKAKTMEH